MKTEFDLVGLGNEKTTAKARIISTGKKKPYVAIGYASSTSSLFIKDKDLERFAVNILKAIGSKKLKQK